MTEAMPFLRKVILLSYDPRPLARGFLLCRETSRFPFGCLCAAGSRPRPTNRGKRPYFP